MNHILHRKDAKNAKKRGREKEDFIVKTASSLLFLSFFAFFASSRCKFLDLANL
jgi:hypothetical protein